MHDLIVIGGGPAGLAAAAYALGKRLDVVMVCAKFAGKAADRQYIAGQREHVALVGEEAIQGFKNHLTAYADRIINDLVIGVFKRDNIFHVMTERKTFHAHAVIVATGAQPTLMGVPHEAQLVGHGLGYSIVTHAQLAAGRDVAVVGTTARALRGVAELIQIARQIVLIAPYPGLLGNLLGQRIRAHPNVHVLEGYHVKAIEAEDGAVHAIVVARREAVQRIPVQAVFVALGLTPNAQIVRQMVQLDEQGFIVVDDRNQTSLPGLFAAGDVTSAFGEQMLVAIGEGARAAASAYDYILAQRMGIQLQAVTITEV